MMRRITLSPAGLILILAGLAGLAGFLAKSLFWGSWTAPVVRTMDEYLSFYNFSSLNLAVTITLLGSLLAILGISGVFQNKLKEDSNYLYLFTLILGIFSFSFLAFSEFLEVALGLVAKDQQNFLASTGVKIYGAFLVNLSGVFFGGALISSVIFYFFLYLILRKSRKFLERSAGRLALLYVVMFIILILIRNDLFILTVRTAQIIIFYSVLLFLGLGQLFGEKFPSVAEPAVKPGKKRKAAEETIDLNVKPKKEKRHFFSFRKNKKSAPVADRREPEIPVTPAVPRGSEVEEKITWKPERNIDLPIKEAPDDDLISPMPISED